MKMTRQRRAILEYLQENREHPTASCILKAVSGKVPSICLATVYNALEALKAEGLIRELSVDPAKKRFDCDTAPHHHMVCVVCGEVLDVDGEYTFRCRDGRDVSVRHVDIYGECPDCVSRAMVYPH